MNLLGHFYSSLGVLHLKFQKQNRRISEMPFIYLLWCSVFQCFACFFLDCLLLYYWVFRVFNIFWLQVLHQIYQQCLLKNRSYVEPEFLTHINIRYHKIGVVLSHQVLEQFITQQYIIRTFTMGSLIFNHQGIKKKRSRNELGSRYND